MHESHRATQSPCFIAVNLLQVFFTLNLPLISFILCCLMSSRRMGVKNTRCRLSKHLWVLLPFIWILFVIGYISLSRGGTCTCDNLDKAHSHAILYGYDHYHISQIKSRLWLGQLPGQDIFQRQNNCSPSIVAICASILLRWWLW